MFQTHGRWRNPPTLVMADPSNMAVSLSHSNRALSDIVNTEPARERKMVQALFGGTDRGCAKSRDCVNVELVGWC